MKGRPRPQASKTREGPRAAWIGAGLCAGVGVGVLSSGAAASPKPVDRGRYPSGMGGPQGSGGIPCTPHANPRSGYPPTWNHSHPRACFLWGCWPDLPEVEPAMAPSPWWSWSGRDGTLETANSCGKSGARALPPAPYLVLWGPNWGDRNGNIVAATHPGCVTLGSVPFCYPSLCLHWWGVSRIKEEPKAAGPLLGRGLCSKSGPERPPCPWPCGGTGARGPCGPPCEGL